MKKTTFSCRQASTFLAVNAVAVLLLTGCATPEQHSFNKDFGEDLPAKPQYHISDETDNRFKITVDQGAPSTDANRLIDVKEAASKVAQAESQRLGWEKWQLNYIQERDQGWMHVVVAEVKRQPFTEPTFPAHNSDASAQ